MGDNNPNKSIIDLDRRAAAVILGYCVTSTTRCGLITASRRAPSPWSSLSGQPGTMWTDRPAPEPPSFTAGRCLRLSSGRNLIGCELTELEPKKKKVNYWVLEPSLILCLRSLITGCFCLLVLESGAQGPSLLWIGFCSSWTPKEPSTFTAACSTSACTASTWSRLR